MKKLALLLVLLSFGISKAQKENYLITAEKDTVFCTQLENEGTKCINGKKVLKYKTNDIIEYKVGDTTYFSIHNYKKKDVLAALLMENDNYKTVQYDYLESSTSGPSVKKTKLLITDKDFNFLTELQLNETTSITLKKYFNNCSVFTDELKKFKSSSQAKRFPFSDFQHLVNVYGNSCQ